MRKETNKILTVDYGEEVESEESFFARTYWNYDSSIVHIYASKEHLLDPDQKPARIVSLKEARKELMIKRSES